MQPFNATVPTLACSTAQPLLRCNFAQACALHTCASINHALLQPAPSGMAEDLAEDYFVVHAASENGESLGEKLLVAVRACKQDDVTALLKEGASLHQLAERTDLSNEMKMVVAESLAALYSAECATYDRIKTSYLGGFVNTSAPITSLAHSRHVYDILRLVHADGTQSEWQAKVHGYRANAPFYRLFRIKTCKMSPPALILDCVHQIEQKYDRYDGNAVSNATYYLAQASVSNRRCCKSKTHICSNSTINFSHFEPLAINTSASS
jgi:hypothetical protein